MHGFLHFYLFIYFILGLTITFLVEELGNLLLKVCCKVELKDGSYVGIVDSLASFIFFLIANINL